MMYVAITGRTCGWLMASKQLMTGLSDVLLSGEADRLRSAEFASGPLRLAGSSDGRLVVIWNREYISGTGAEDWCVMRIDAPCGLSAHSEISAQVFERSLYVANQRLQGLMLESDLIHRPWPNGAHSCLAGRGTEARQFSIGYSERNLAGATGTRSILILGPEHDFDTLTNAVEREAPHLPALADLANSIVDEQRRRPVLDSPVFATLRAALSPQTESSNFNNVSIETEYDPDAAKIYETVHWSFNDWIGSGRLNEVQRRVLDSRALEKHPVRIIGPAGSGKTLLMQLLAIRYLKDAEERSAGVRILYVVHNAAMVTMVTDRLKALGAEEYLTSSKQSIAVSTLSEYGRTTIGILENSVIDRDAHKTKLFQLDQIRDALRQALDHDPSTVSASPLLSQIRSEEALLHVFAILVMAEISAVIKGRGLTHDEKRYVGAEAPFSRLHRLLKAPERAVIFDCFRRYHDVVFEQYAMLDSDDVALSLFGRLKTPVWELRRKSEGYDFIFVDEAQLFNENERRVFPYLSKGQTSHVPIVLALDEAQEPFGFSAAGLATLGIENVENETLPSNHRSTREIVDLAFFIIQRTTDLFGTDFPDFADVEVKMLSSANPMAAVPVIHQCNEEAKNFGRFVLKTVQRLRSRNVRQIAVICHTDSYWADLAKELSAGQLPLHIIAQRGEKLSPDQPLVVLSRPSFVGGQEFDAVILVGLEQGLVPPRVVDNPPLAAALEQQVLREMYLAVTRARYRVVVVVNKGARPNAILADAQQRGLISVGSVA